MPTKPAPPPLVFSIGHYLGALVASPDEGGRVHQVRRGADIEELTEDRFRVWAVAQGSAEQQDTPWTRSVVEDFSVKAGVADPGPVVSELLAAGLLAEVAPDAPREFALRHQLRPLMLGLGNSSDEPWLYGIGFGSQPVLKVTREVYGLWEWAHRDENLWHACETFAEVESGSGGTEPELTDPARVLDGLLSGLHNLTATTAAYLDIAQLGRASE